MKYRKFLTKINWVCGAVFLALAYTPCFMKLVSTEQKKEGDLVASADSGAGSIDVDFVSFSSLDTGSLNGNLAFFNFFPLTKDYTDLIAKNAHKRFLSSVSAGDCPLSLSSSASIMYSYFFNDSPSPKITDLVKSVELLNVSYKYALAIVNYKTVSAPRVLHAPKTGCLKCAVNIPGYSGLTFVKGRLKSNFYADAKEWGIPSPVINSFVKCLSSKLNFKRSLRVGDRFELIYGRDNKVLYGKILSKRAKVSVYRFTEGRETSYYLENGDRYNETGAGSMTFIPPLAGKLSISDGFGWRKHPFTKRNQYHSGVDLRATMGTPVRAMQDGVVTRASYFGGYGKCVDIAHADGYSTRYGHLSKIVVREGMRIRKGQKIGDVGSSGMSTGPHLHIELACNKKVMNPLSVRVVQRSKKTQKNNPQFKLWTSQVQAAIKKVDNKN